MLLRVFFFNDTATTEIYTYLHTLSLHDALPIYSTHGPGTACLPRASNAMASSTGLAPIPPDSSSTTRAWTPWSARRFRSEEHTSELQSLMRISYAVFCLKKKNS